MLILITLLELMHASDIAAAIGVFVVGAVTLTHLLHALREALEIAALFIDKVNADVVKVIVAAQKLWDTICDAWKQATGAFRRRDDDKEGK